MFDKLNFNNSLLCLCVGITVLFWYFFYKFTTTEYDENANNLAYSILTAFLNMMLLILHSNKVEIISKRDKVIKIIIFVIGTPLTLILIIFYFLTLKMNYVNSSYFNNENKSFEIVKFRNIFYARNTLILNNLSKNSDTLYGEVSKNGKKIIIYKKENSIKIYVDNFEAKKKLSKKQYKELTTF
jgi:hypothetical protein